MPITSPGLYPDLSCAEYFADPCPAPSLTQSLAKLLIAKSPLHAKHAHPRLRDPVVEEEEVEKYEKAKAIGSAAHSIMLGRGKDLFVAPFDSWRTQEARLQREAAEADGLMPILREHYEVAVRMVTAGQDQLAAAGFEDVFAIDRGNSEVCIAWEEDGFWFRSLIDWLPHDRQIAWDYKTTEMSVAPHGVGRLMADAGWDIQAAMHERGLRVLHDCTERYRFRFVAQEQQPPFGLVVVELSDEVLELGRRRLEYAVRLWRSSMLSGEWPGYPARLIKPEYPAWAEATWLNREIHEAAEARVGEREGNVLMAG